MNHSNYLYASSESLINFLNVLELFVRNEMCFIYWHAESWINGLKNKLNQKTIYACFCFNKRYFVIIKQKRNVTLSPLESVLESLYIAVHKDFAQPKRKHLSLSWHG